MTKRYRSLSSLPPRIKVLEPRKLQTLPRIRIVDRAHYRERTRQRAELIRRDGPLCWYCTQEGRVSAGEQMDHTIPLKDGGVDDISNMRLICDTDHVLKSAKEAAERAKRVGEPEQQSKPLKDYKVF
jgi:5-methylcytosine-specific restriction protein A